MNEVKMKRRWFGALAAVGALQAAGFPGSAMAQSTALDAIRRRGSLRVGWAIWVPYMFLDPATRQQTGITVALAQGIAEHMGLKAEFVETTWATMVAGVQAGQYEMTMPCAITEERARAVSFSVPIVNQNWGLTVHKSKVGQYKTWEDLNKPGVRISATMGSTGAKFAKILDKAEHILVKDGSDSIAQLLTGQADAWMAPWDTYRTAAKHQPNLALVPGSAIAREEIGMGLRKDDAPLKAAVDAAIVELKRNGKLLAMLQNYGIDGSSMA